MRVQSTMRVLSYLIKVDSIKLFIDSRRLLRFLMSSGNVSNVYSIELETKDWVSNRQNDIQWRKEIRRMTEGKEES